MRKTIKDFPELFNYAKELLATNQERYPEFIVKIRKKAEEIGDIVLIIGEPRMSDDSRGKHLIEAEITAIDTENTIKEMDSFLSTITIDDLIKRVRKSEDKKLYGFRHARGNLVICGLRTRQNILFGLRKKI